MTNYDEYLKKDGYINYDAPEIEALCKRLFTETMTDIEKLTTAFEYLRENVPHSFRAPCSRIAATASDTLKYKTGVCHAHSNLLCALMRREGIPAGLRFQRILLFEKNREYCIHCFNSVNINGKWLECDLSSLGKDDAQKLRNGVSVHAFENTDRENEFFFEGIYPNADAPTMEMLTRAETLTDVTDGLVREEKSFCERYKKEH